MYSIILSLLLFTNPPTLTWGDFKGPVPETEINVAARTRTALEYTSTDSNGVFTCHVEAVFLSDESWGRIKTDEVLRHEQGHYDLARLCALECNWAFLKREHQKGCTESALQSIYRHYLKEVDRLNDLYDRETSHSMSGRIQQLWLKNISNDLKKLQ